jgi:VanZ family protein
MDRLRALCRVALPPAALLVLLLSVIRIDHALTGDFGDKIEHALGYFLLAALAGTGHAGSRAEIPLMIGLIAFGLFIECLQWWLPWREFSLLDWLADGVGVFAWVTGAWLLRRAAA